MIFIILNANTNKATSTSPPFPLVHDSLQKSTICLLCRKHFPRPQGAAAPLMSNYNQVRQRQAVCWSSKRNAKLLRLTKTQSSNGASNASKRCVSSSVLPEPAGALTQKLMVGSIARSRAAWSSDNILDLPSSGYLALIQLPDSAHR